MGLCFLTIVRVCVCVCERTRQSGCDCQQSRFFFSFFFFHCVVLLCCSFFKRCSLVAVRIRPGAIVCRESTLLPSRDLLPLSESKEVELCVCFFFFTQHCWKSNAH